MSFGNFVARLDPDNIVLKGIDLRSNVGRLLQQNVDRLKKNVKGLSGTKSIKKGYGLSINVDSKLEVTPAKLTLDTSEAYAITIRQQEDGQVYLKIVAACVYYYLLIINCYYFCSQLIADISGDNYFGARHGLETLSQLIVYDDLYGDLKIARDVFIQDAPAFPYRGILLDTARNFMDKASILRTIEAMAMSKMNTFHWHITDSHSFPYVSRTWPNFSKYGAYTPDKIYSEQDIKEIVQFGLVRGVRVLPEFDAPAHVGEGWQWVRIFFFLIFTIVSYRDFLIIVISSKVGHNTTVCFKAEPWQRYCVEPPCGQLNPTSEKVYDILEGIFTDMVRDFQPDFFHMGGDEVNINCWNSSDIIKDWMTKKGWDLSESSFYQLWDHFQSKAYDKLTKANNGKELDAVLWTSGLTNEENLKHLDPKKYIIQIWTTGADATIGRLIKNNFRVIFSNYDALYLDCG